MSKEGVPLKKHVAHISQINNLSEAEIEDQISRLSQDGKSKPEIFRLLTHKLGRPKAHYSQALLSFNRHKEDKHK